MDTPRRIAVAGGGTAGHVAAGLAFLEAYRQEYGAHAYFIGCRHGMEERLVEARGEEIQLIAGSPYEREGWTGRLRALINAIRGMLEARPILRSRRTELVIGVGGYASVGAGLAAWWLGIPVVLHEANARPGKANQFLARFATRVCLAFPEAGDFLKAKVVSVTGNPTGAKMRPAVADAGATTRFLVTGGSEGSPFLNERTPELFAKLRAAGVQARVRHLSGDGDAAAVQEAYEQAGVDCSVSVRSSTMEDEYAQADFVVTGAGAITLAEIAAAGLPALVVPVSGASAGHQDFNARAFSAQTGAHWISEKNWDSAAEASWIAAVLRDPVALAKLRRRTSGFGRPDAARALVRVCEEILEKAS